MKINDEQLRGISQAVDETLEQIEGKKVGFCLLAFEFGNEPGRMVYSSNALREDMIEALREFLHNHENTPPGEEPPVQIN